MQDLFRLNEEAMQAIEERMEVLRKEGVEAFSAPSEELNMSGCHRGYCMAWD